MKEKQIIILASAAVAVLCLVVWNLYSRRQRRDTSRLRNAVVPNHYRANDQRPLTRQEQRVKRQAHKLIAKGKIIPAAQMLEQIGFYREAIDALENGRLFDDAVRVLMRLQRPGRAGVLYSRNGLWEPAAQCYLQAGDPLNAAKCFKEAGKLAEAAELFVKSAQFSDAAECLEKIGHLGDAARNWLKMGKIESAVDAWNKLGEDKAMLAVFRPSHDEFDIMFESLKTKSHLTGIVKILSRAPQASSMILELLSTKSFKTAELLFQHTPAHQTSSLISDVNIQSPAAPLLVTLFENAEQHRSAAILLEQLERFTEAAEAFKKSGEKERSDYCLSRANSDQVSKPSASAPKNISENRPAEVKIPRANFFIGTESPTAAPSPSSMDESSAARPTPLMKVASINTQPSVGPEMGLTITPDEVRLISRSWIFSGINEEDVENFIACFSAMNLCAGHTILSGSRDTFLVMAITGDLISPAVEDSSDGWLAPESGLAGQNPTAWKVTSATARVVSVKAADFNAILSGDADLTRIVYTNLTQRLLEPASKRPKLKVI